MSTRENEGSFTRLADIMQELNQLRVENRDLRERVRQLTQPEPPTNKEIDDWAGTNVAGMIRYATGWHDNQGALRYTPEQWQPTRYLTQALECTMETNVDLDLTFVDTPVGDSTVKRAHVWKHTIRGWASLYPENLNDPAPFDPEAMAEAIMRHLYEELEGNHESSEEQ